MTTLLWIVALTWGVGLGFGLVLYALDRLLGFLHRRRSQRRSLWY
jgi:hypothetical protein